MKESLYKKRIYVYICALLDSLNCKHFARGVEPVVFSENGFFFLLKRRPVKNQHIFNSFLGCFTNFPVMTIEKPELKVTFNSFLHFCILCCSHFSVQSVWEIMSSTSWQETPQLTCVL